MSKPKISTHRVERTWEEFQCENCASPVYVGEEYFYAESALADGAGCTRLCALRAHQNWAGRKVGEEVA